MSLTFNLFRYAVTLNAAKFVAAFFVAWGFTEALAYFFSDYAPPSELRYGLLAVFVFASFMFSLDVSKRVQPFDVRLFNSIQRGAIFLKTANKNEAGQRRRNFPSLMETSTVVGCLLWCSRELEDFDPDVPNETIEWLWSELKKRLYLNERVKYFGCSKCNIAGKSCNIAYFDYLSHFYYVPSGEFFERFNLEFSFLRNVIRENYTDNGELGGFSQRSGGELDALATSTMLILNSRFDALTKEQVEKCFGFLSAYSDKLTQPMQAGSSRNNSDTCCADFKIVSCHRIIEAISACKSVTSYDDLGNKCRSYLLNAPSEELPTTYQSDVGYDDPVVIRALGHIIQGLSKPMNTSELDFLKQKVEIIMNHQKDTGEFFERSDLFGSEVDQSNTTDLTAFIVRTLLFFRRSLQLSAATDTGNSQYL